MKVLFAVSSESISDAIIKRYQREYKEILSYKNVYYFNAILKEIQKDKTYDRIVISEDLEPFSNNNYDTIDKFIFEKLDNISDEAQDSEGKETSIILICTDRHTKGSSFLVKLFGIGVYNALLGNDRSMENVCKLINRPRVKKEAKMYYKIDADDVSYDPKSDKEVSELEIQNILTHFKKIAKNKEKFADSFNNIATQYTDDQLKIIINCLPINVKAVLEEECPKYQEIMSVGGVIQKVARANVAQDAKEKTGIKIDILENKLEQQKMSGPIVIPSTVKNAKSRSTGVKPSSSSQVVQAPQVKKLQNAQSVEQVRKNVEPSRTRVIRQPVEEVIEDDDDLLLTLDDEPQNTVSHKVPQKNLTPSMFIDDEDDDSLILNDEEENQEDVDSLINQKEESKKGRGRPRKYPVDDMPKPKGKRGRPKKINEDNIKEDEEDDDSLVLDFDDDELDINPVVENEENTQDTLQTMEDDYEEEDGLLPGLEEQDEEVEDDDLLLNMDDNEDDEDDSLVLDDDEYNDVDDNENEEEDDNTEYTEEVSIPGLDELDDYEEDDMLPGMDDDYLLDDDDYLLNDSSTSSPQDKTQNTNQEDDSLLLDFEDDYSDNTNNSDYKEEYEEPIVNSNNYAQPSNSAIESIKPQVDYSMSNLNSLLTKDKKVVTFLGTTKNGTSFLINNLAALFSSLGINTAVLDMTQNRNSYYIYTKNEEELRKIAYNSIEKLQNGFAEGIRVDKNLSIYTALPNDGKDYSNAEPILSTLVQNHSLVLIDCDFNTDPSYFANCQEIYLVQSMDILTIQPLTYFLRDLKSKGVLESEKVRVVVNKEIKIRTISSKDIIAGMSFYNDPAMSFMTELFNKEMVKACSIPFEDNAYAKYLDSMVNCNVSLNGYSKAFLSKLRILGDMVYPLTSKQTYGKPAQSYPKNAFSNSINNTLSQMKNKY